MSKTLNELPEIPVIEIPVPREIAHPPQTTEPEAPEPEPTTRSEAAK